MRYYLYLPAALLILLAGCNLDEDNSSRKTTHPKPKTDSPVVKTVPVTPQSQPAAGQYGYITAVRQKEGHMYIDADYIQFLMGDAAIAAAKKKHDEVLDDYYIINDNPAIRTLKLTGNFQYIAVESDSAARPGEKALKRLHAAIKNKQVFVLRLNGQGEVAEIKEQFLP